MDINRGKVLGWSFVAGVAGIVFLLARFSDLIVDWMWLDELGYAVIFYRLLMFKVGFGGLFGLIALLVVGVNLHIAVRRAFPDGAQKRGNVIELYGGEQVQVPVGLLRWGAWLLAALASVPFALYANSRWDVFVRFFWRVPYGQTDPVYGRDIGFYLFSLPFWEVLQNALTSLLFLSFIGALGVYVLAGMARQQGGLPQQPTRRTTGHLSVLFVLFLAGYGWGYYLERFALLFSQTGTVSGAGYTDLHVVRIGLWVMLAASVALAAIVFFAYVRNQPKISIVGVGGYFVLLLAVLMLAPVGVQKFIVEPNELELEAPFLEHEIRMTRQAYGIDAMEERDYPAISDLTFDKVQENEQTLKNIRLWDWRPLLQTFRQLQEIRLYYEFYEVDIDRYTLDGAYRQVMLSARELARELPERADTWVNRTLQFTHGYGLVMSLASQEGEEGTPTLLVQDLPPVTPEGLNIEMPAIFYGENMQGYRIVDTGVKELDYPKGDENVYTSYAGDGGVPIDAFWKKLLFAWELGDVNILLSDYLTDKSQIQLRRQVRERVTAVAPFLRYDGDPYLVVSEGRLYWIQDAYTTSETYPYSEPYQGRFNYIRNSVKVVNDVYNGAVDFYMMQPDEPVLKVYQRAFPGVFRPLGEMSADLQTHVRYPEDLFRIQVDKYNRYHMTIPQVFYNNEDLWTTPQEKYGGTPQAMEPYYILMRLPEEERLEFLLMQPLTPQKRNNMIAWVAARCDQPDYGQLLVYKLPKDKLILGPMQIEAMIDQDPIISRQLSLWDQRGSQVIRGNLLVIPIDHSFLYVEPVYLIAEGNNIPQLRRVIVSYDERVVMEPTLEQAVRAVFGAAPAAQAPEEGAARAPVALPRNLEKAQESFERAQQALQAGDWEAFGRAMGDVQEILQRREPVE